ncbi:hypothetical protein [Bacillus paralicheniformis]|uniref:hypothetical protein n=1 Tax=Bacillus paralicheniformis TaxID=1648923 RepID=UPI00232F9D4A|nr:hypothetical protein [Bacillus paralicheniformis]MED1221524.1 hypothetical protein [Bacillus paralicheniformis]
MNFVFTVSGLKKVSDVRVQCRKARENPVGLLMVEAEIKGYLRRKAASQHAHCFRHKNYWTNLL